MSTVMITGAGSGIGLEIALAAGVPFVVYVMALVPSVFMSDGTLSTSITSAVWAILLCILAAPIAATLDTGNLTLIAGQSGSPCGGTGSAWL